MTRLQLRRLRWKLRLLGWFKIPMIGYTAPTIVSIDEERAVIEVKFGRRTKNHLGSMYLGALAVGADVAAGIHVFYFSELSQLKVSFAFKSMEVQFIKRATSSVQFSSHQGKEIAKLLKESQESGERRHQIISVEAKDTVGELVAVFKMEISVKVI